jgi:hypothetical protein
MAKELGVPVKQLKWAQLDGRLKHDLLVGAMLDRGNFWESRAIPYVEAPRRPKVVHLYSAVTLDGKVYGPGEGKLPPAFIPLVEYLSPSDARLLEGVELHRMKRGRGSDNVAETFSLTSGFDDAMSHQHLHIPYRPRQRRSRPMYAVLRTDHFRRAELFGALLAAARSNCLEKTSTDGVVFFNFADAGWMTQLNDHFQGVRPLGRGRLKMGAIGYRTGIYRNQKTGEVTADEGYEIRHVRVGRSAKEDALTGAWVDAVQLSLATGSYGLKQRPLRRWFLRHFGKVKDDIGGQNEVLAGLHYNRDFNEMLDKPPAHLVRYLTPQVKALFRRNKDNFAIKMLIHDWSSDSIWLSLTPGLRRAAIEQTRQAQLEVLDKLQKNLSSAWLARMVGHFLRATKLIECTGRSLGMNQLSASRLDYSAAF